MIALIKIFSFLFLSVNAATVNLAWDASPDADVLRYQVYVQRESASFQPVLQTAELKASVQDLEDLTQYAFYVTALNDTLESDPSGICYWISRPVLKLDPKVGLTLRGVTGWSYEVQQSPDLINWTVLQTVKFVDATLTLQIDLNQPQLFFRMRQI